MRLPSAIVLLLAASASLHCAKAKERVSAPVGGSGETVQAPPSEGDGGMPELPLPPWEPLEKPFAATAPSDATDRCRALGRRASARKIGRLIVAFEGLASYDGAGTARLYAAYERNPTLPGDDDPAGPRAAGYFLHRLMVPLLKAAAGRLEFLVFPHDSVNDSNGGLPQLCLESFLKFAPRTKITIAGHSYGGHAANQLARRLDAAGIALDSVFTLDPRTKFYVGSLGRTGNAEVWHNFYQRNTPFLNGFIVPGADTNLNLSSTGVGHTGLPGRDEVFAAVAARLLTD